MIKESFLSSNGRDTIACYLFEPEQPPRAVLQISHGMCEYMVRYGEFARFLNSQGVAVCGNDHLGHGESASGPEERGFLGKGGWGYLVEDLHKLTLRMKEKHPGLPYFLLGHSMGSFAARAYLTRYGSELDGALIMGTSGGNPLSGAGICVEKLLTLFYGDHHRSRLLQSMAFSSYNKRFPGEGDSAWLTRDRIVTSKYAGDEHCNFIFTTDGFDNLFHLLNAVSRKDWAGTVPKELPILLLSGEDDPVGDYGKGVLKVNRRLKEAGVRDLTCKLYAKGRHELINETNRQDVYDDIAAWLNKHIPK